MIGISVIKELKTPNPNTLEVADFVLHTVYNRASNEKAPGDSRYAMLFVKNKKGQK